MVDEVLELEVGNAVVSEVLKQAAAARDLLGEADAARHVARGEEGAAEQAAVRV